MNNGTQKYAGGIGLKKAIEKRLEGLPSSDPQDVIGTIQAIDQAITALRNQHKRLPPNSNVARLIEEQIQILLLQRSRVEVEATPEDVKERKMLTLFLEFIAENPERFESKKPALSGRKSNNEAVFSF